MRRRRALGVSLLTLAIAVGVSSVALATHSPTGQQVVSLATGSPWLMSCPPATGTVQCLAGNGDNVAWWTADITPPSGNLVQVQTEWKFFVGDSPQSNDINWMNALHNAGCNNASAVAVFVRTTLGLAVGGATGPTTVGECSMVGSHNEDPVNLPVYHWFTITSTVSPSAFPSPTPTPTPKPTATPTLQPTATPTPSSTPTESPTPTATPTPTPTPTASPTAPGSNEVSASPEASATPEGGQEGVGGTPEPTAAGGGKPDGGDSWAGSVPLATEVSAEPVDVGVSALLALLLLVMMGFVGELFNNTLENNYDRVVGWWRTSWAGRIGQAFARFWSGGGSA